MSSSETDANKIKKQIVIRYPLTFYEEISRSLAIFKTLRGNKKYFRALPVMDELIDYACMEPVSGKFCFELTDEEKKKIQVINIPKELIIEFNELFHGTEDDWDGKLGLQDLSPGTSISNSLPTVLIRKAMPFLEAYGAFDPEWVAHIARFSYKVTKQNIIGNAITETVPMIASDDPRLYETFTIEIPRVVFTRKFDKQWNVVAPICTRIERLIAMELTSHNIPEAVVSMQQLKDSGYLDDDDDDPLDLS